VLPPHPKGRGFRTVKKMKEDVFARGIKSRHASLIAIGGIVGSSFFLGTGYIFNQIGPFVFLAFILGAVITFLTMECQAELAGAEEPTHHSFVAYASTLPAQ